MCCRKTDLTVSNLSGYQKLKFYLKLNDNFSVAELFCLKLNGGFSVAELFCLSTRLNCLLPFFIPFCHVTLT